MQLQEVRNTGLIEIGIYDTDAQRAANIANTIAVVYQEKRRTDLSKNVDRGLEQLEEEVEKQRKVVEEAARQGDEDSAGARDQRSRSGQGKLRRSAAAKQTMVFDTQAGQ